MKNKIKQLRIEIDGLAKLVKELNPIDYFTVDIDSIPNGIAMDKFLEMFEKGKIEVVDTHEAITPKMIYHGELEKSYDSLILAKAWLGKILGELGAKTPYKNDGNRKSIEDIEEAADTSNLGEEGKILYSTTNTVLARSYMTQKEWDNKFHIEKVDWLREKIKTLVVEIQELFSEVSIPRSIATAQTNSYNHLSEARFWLGFELQRIKELENKK